ncbi:MAG: hypothetical protein JW940_33540 [Polyangiaceae bacterium]|nr:hypothetical protein [Polyangiaceae bacterium]
MARATGVSYALSLVVCSLAPSLGADTIHVTPSDSYDAIEGAQAGDEVVIAPGTYAFRVYLEAQGTASDPIVIRAEDPNDPPIWDLSGDLVDNAPGSYTAGDRGRGCWQFRGASNIELSGIVITGCHNAAGSSAGIRYYGGSTGIVVRDVLFVDNDNGLTGGTEDSEITVEYCEFDGNGNLQASAATHNIYIYAGTFTLRYSYVHDPIHAQNFHIRARESLIENNWFARAKSYAGDLMTSDDYSGSGELTQTMNFRGNVVIQGAQDNGSQIIAVYNDEAPPGALTLNVNASYNTFIGTGTRAGFVHLSNADLTAMSAVVSNNILFGTTRPVYSEEDSAQISGTNNWLMTGADENGLTGSIFDDDPGFADPDANDFTLADGSSAIGAAEPPASGAPDHEYYRDESVICLQRVRASAHDLGAFESTTTGDGTGPDGAPIPATGGSSGTGGTPSGGNTSTGGGNTAGRTGSGGTPSGGTTSGGGRSGGGRTSAGGRSGGGDTSAGGEPSGGSDEQGGAGPSSGGSDEQGGVGPTADGGRTSSSGGSDGQPAAGAGPTGGTGGRAATATGGTSNAGSAGADVATAGSFDLHSIVPVSDDDDEGGCGCRLGGSQRSATAALLWAALALVGARQRAVRGKRDTRSAN